MEIQNIDQSLLYNAYHAKVQEHSHDDVQAQENMQVNNEHFSHKDSTFHNVAVDLSISMESIKVFINLKSVEMTKDNTSAQNVLHNFQNDDVMKFLSGEELENGFSLSAIGYNGKPITELTQNEAKELVSDEGFFGVTQTSDRVSSFVIGLAGDNIEALQESRRGIVEGFEEAERMWGGKLPDISYKTQERTLEIVDEKIAELLKTDLQKEAESLDSSNENKEDKE